MPVTYRIHDDILEMAIEGNNAPDDVINTFNTAIEDPACPAKVLLFFDVRASTSLATRPTADIIRVAEHLGPFKERVARCAVLATADVHFGLSRLGAVYSESAGVMTSVFRTREEALAWLRAGSTAQ